MSAARFEIARLGGVLAALLLSACADPDRGATRRMMPGDGGAEAGIADVPHGEAGEAPEPDSATEDGDCDGSCTLDLGPEPGDARTGDGAVDAGADGSTAIPDCPPLLRTFDPCTSNGAVCVSRCTVCGVTPGGAGVLTREPITCQCGALDPGNPARLQWSCEAIDCIIDICHDYVDAACTEPVPCQNGQPIAPPPCGSETCAPGSYCEEPVPGDPSTYRCVAIPAACASSPICSCLQANGVSCACSVSDGALFVAC